MTIWTRQPQRLVGLNKRDGWQAGWAFSNLADQGGSGPVVLGTGASRIARSDGINLSVRNATNLGRAVLTAGQWDKPGAGDFTVAIKFRSVAIQYCIVGRWNTGASPSTCDWYTGSSSGADAVFVVACGSTTYTASVAASWAANGEYALIARRRGTTITVDRINYADGSRHTGTTTNAGITTINSNSSRALKLGEIDAAASYNSELDSSVVALANRAISDSEVSAWFRNPWQSFAEYDDDVLVGPAASGAVDITGAVTDASDTASGSVTTEWDVSGAVTDGSDTASGSLTAEHDIAGAATDASDVAAGSVTVGAIEITGAATDGPDVAAGSVTTELDVTGSPTDASDTAAGVLLGVSLVTGAATDGADTASGVISNPEARRAEQPAGRPSKDRKRRRVIVNDTLYEVPERDIPALIEAALRNSTPPGTAEEVATPKAAHPITRKASRKSQPVVIEQPTIDDVEQRAEALRVEFAAQAHIDMLTMLDRISARVLIELQDEDDALTALLLA